ncbi:Gfo/Idh/MocA family protein [Arthrobacter sp. ISL-30]|uniref:Gfo/Idh/MocA family protein n=1 Tax=Arthrobacter sp. ISL-30 TaxID=2819109 RepID=UPI001BE5FB34|nr:Gfo/Idh/MocA family oxidoreductase [Arthrobacter sp. ISL-30]MBT2512333.1 Gfo/Idh/MocA family oxidoreductase [Arthrobacter sp. ISL-30]
MTTQQTGPEENHPLRVGIIGTGGIAHAHAGALLQQEGIELAVAIDVEPSRSEAFADKFAIGRTAVSLADALNNGALDMVAVCTPPSSHQPLALEALSYGLHVVIEKPPALSLRQMRELQHAEAASAGSVSCIFQHRFGSAAQRLVSLQSLGLLGKPLVGACNTFWFRDQAYFDVPWRGRWDVEGGGPTMGHGIHQFDLLTHVWGPWAEVTAFASKLARQTDTEDVSAAIVRFESGAIATITSSVISPRETSQLRLDYEFATVELEHLYGYSNNNWSFTPAPGSEELRAAWASDDDVASGHLAQYKAIVDALSTGSPASVSLQDAYATMELAAAIYASSLTGMPIERGQIDEANPFYSRMDGHLEPWKQQEASKA